MNKKELSKLLLNSPREYWPGVWKSISLPMMEMPENVRSNIQSLINETVESNKIIKRKRMQSVWFAAAILPIAVILGVVLKYYSSDPHDFIFQVSHKSGNIELITENQNNPVKISNKIKSGNTIHINGKGKLFFRAGDNIIFQISGPARIKVKTRNIKNILNMNFYIYYGSIALRSKKSHAKSPIKMNVIWETKRLIYRMKGTVARLSVDRDTEAIKVYKGAFTVRNRQSDKSVSVAGGQVLNSRNNRIDIKKLTDKDIKDLELLVQSIAVIEKGEKLLEPLKKFKTHEDIFAYYGFLHSVTLKDGRVFTGYAAKRGNEYKVHTLYGIITIQNKYINSINDLKK